MWKHISRHLWIAISANGIPADLVVPGYVLLVGIRTIASVALVQLLQRLDHYLSLPEAFTIPSVGFYCSEECFQVDVPLPTDRGQIVADGSLLCGCHALQYEPLSGRPLLMQEATQTALHTHAVVGLLTRFLLVGEPRPELLAQNWSEHKLPPALKASLRLAKCIITDGGEKRTHRRGRRLLHRALFVWDPFDDESLRQLHAFFTTEWSPSLTLST